MKIIALTQARFASSRLPGKVLKTIGDKTLLELHLKRAKKSNKIHKLIVATTNEPQANEIITIAKNCGCQSFKGSTDDVLDRFYQIAKKEKPDYIVRITSDCPLIDADLMDDIISFCIKGNYDYCANTIIPTYPDGMDVEIFTFSSLEKSWNEAVLLSDREHVTPFIWKNATSNGGTLFNSYNFANKIDYSQYRLTVDEEVDLELIRELVKVLGDDRPWIDYINYLKNSQTIINNQIKRNEGYMKSIEVDKIKLRKIDKFQASEAYRSKIHNLIPGGSHTYSKGDDQFPQLSPAAIDYGKGAYVWDIDGNKFLDCSMGLTSVSLGHAYEPVLEKVRKELERGVNFQRPSILEMQTAELFLSLVPQHDMIKFSKNGSTVTTAAVKLSRAYTGRKYVAFPYDHPFYSYDDWFIGKTDCNKGVPSEISSLSLTYKADDLNSLKELFEKYPDQIACVISEPEKNWGIPENYLENAINLAHQYGALYIVDEMITGFKTDFPGSIKKYNVSPDLTTWGKGIANGFSFCALTGKKEVMELGGIMNNGTEKVFLISTTHGGETHAMAAAMATINIFRGNDIINYNHSIGHYLNTCCSEVIEKHKLNEIINLAPSDWMPAFVFKNNQKEISAGFRTLVMQEMIQRGVLFQGIFVPTISHTHSDVDYFVDAFDKTLDVYVRGLEDGYQKFLVGEPVKPVFRKYL